MRATNVNNTGRVEKNAKVLAGECIFPFTYKYETHSSCIPTNKGDICATEVSKRGTLVKYGYCQTDAKSSPKKGTAKKALSRTSSNTQKHSRKLKSNSSSLRSASKSKSGDKYLRKLKSKSGSKGKASSSSSKSRKMATKVTLKRRKLVVKPDLKTSAEAVQQPQMESKQVFNEEFINVLGELATIMQRQGEPFRARAYQKAQETLMTYPGDITNFKQLEGLPGIGKTILSKLEEYQKTGTLAVLERERNNPLNILTNIYGVGPKKAKELIDAGLDSLEKIKALSAADLNKRFNANQRKGLEYYDDINQKIPRAEIIQYEQEFDKVVRKCCGAKTRFEVVGSYRRGKAFSGDIDVIITNQDNDTTVFSKFLDALKEDGILEYTFSRGNTKSLTMCRLTPETPVARRVDFLYTSPEEYPFAILYFTGSKIFNTVMRQKALSLGYTLNEHGLSHMKAGVKGHKVDHKFKTEQDIFDFLGMKYKAPSERIDGRAVQDKTASAEAAPSVAATVPSDTIMNVVVESPKPSDQPKPKAKAAPRKTLKKAKADGEKEMAAKFREEGVSYLQGLSENQIIDLIVAANDAYYNKKPFLTDDEFDIVKELAEQKFPDNPALAAIGAPVEKGKVKLPYNMPSMNKIKPDTDALTKWEAKYKGPFVTSAKLDGVSGMFVKEDGKMKLYTRGDGTYGQDVSHLIPYLRLPTKASSEFAIRGEFIIAKKLFAEKYAAEFSNPRNFIAGLINSKTKMPTRFRDIDFVAYEVVNPPMKPSEQFKFLSQLSVDVVYNKLVGEKELTNEFLSMELVELRDNYKYEIDGVIVADDKVYPRSAENPDHAFAFKMVLGDQVAEVKVLDVLWSASKDGYLKPRVQVEPVVLGGARIEYATGFNAKFIEDNKIGVGAVIQLVRSGDVIPHILSVVRPAEKPMMPQVPWKWNATHVDAVLEDKSQDQTVLIKTATAFFKHLDTVGMGPGNVTKLVEAGLTSLPEIYLAPKDKLQSILGKKTGEMAYENIKKSVDDASLPKLMAATNIFGRGFGEKRFESILENIPGLFTAGHMDKARLVDKLAEIKGLSKKSAEEFVQALPAFEQFIQETQLQSKLQFQAKDKGDESHPLFGKKVVMTGFRDKQLQAEIEEKGGSMSGSVSKNTFVVLVKDKDEDTGKADQARKLGIPMMTPEEFRAKYL